MTFQALTRISLPWLRIAASVNFIASLIFLLIVTTSSMIGSTFFFEDSSDLYGPMASNLRIMMVYLCVTELAVIGFCRYSRHYQAVTLLGIFLLLLTISMEFYSVINEVTVDENYATVFLYLGLSHLCFGLLQRTQTPTES
jgi:hypothetical protein